MPRRSRYTIIVLAILTFSLAQGCASGPKLVANNRPSTPVLSEKERAAAIAKARGPEPEQVGLWAGRGLDVLDESTAATESVGLDKGSSEANPAIRFPDAGVVGDPLIVMVLSDQSHSRGNTGLAILYSSGIRFFATPNREPENYRARLGDLDRMGIPPFKDKRKSRGHVVDLNGTEALVLPGGTIEYPTGESLTAYPYVSWQRSGITYELKSRVVSVEDLAAAAQSVAPPSQ